MRSAPGRSARGPPRSTDRPPLGAPLFLLNLKTYPTATGPRAVAFAVDLARAGREAGVAVALAPAAPDLALVAALSSVAALAQHVDLTLPGASTGSLPAETAAAAGARGSLVNHAEHRLPAAEVDRTVRRLAEVHLAAVVCAGDVPAARRLAACRPPYLAIEPPELIGGSRSVSTAKPEVVARGVEAVRAVSPGTRVLCGAGIRTGADVRRALELGAAGVLVASAVALVRRPRAAMDELLSGF